MYVQSELQLSCENTWNRTRWKFRPKPFLECLGRWLTAAFPCRREFPYLREDGGGSCCKAEHEQRDPGPSRAVLVTEEGSQGLTDWKKGKELICLCNGVRISTCGHCICGQTASLLRESSSSWWGWERRSVPKQELRLGLLGPWLPIYTRTRELHLCCGDRVSPATDTESCWQKTDVFHLPSWEQTGHTKGLQHLWEPAQAIRQARKGCPRQSPLEAIRR